ncbi:MAG TPA: hypothetical protein VIX59_07275 [Candidatus Binataceae bacterium]
MKLRHAAAFALVGWYLMLPPAAKWMAQLLETGKPLSEWDAQESFDTAQECKAAQRKIENFLESELSKQHEEAESDQSYLDDPIVQSLFGVQARIRTSRCIASDDPRLKAK